MPRNCSDLLLLIDFFRLTSFNRDQIFTVIKIGFGCYIELLVDTLTPNGGGRSYDKKDCKPAKLGSTGKGGKFEAKGNVEEKEQDHSGTGVN